MATLPLTLRLVTLVVSGGQRLIRWMTPTHREELKSWLGASVEKACRDLGLGCVIESRSWNHVSATCGPFLLDLRVGMTQDDDRTRYQEELRLTLDAEALPRTLRFDRERGDGDDVFTGDSLFDDNVDVRGEPSVVLARFDKALRDSARQFVLLGGSLKAGRLALSGFPVASALEIPRVVRSALDVAQKLSDTDGGGVCARLGRNVEQDPLSGVRLWNLLQLQEQFAATPEAERASRTALVDKSVWVRLSAARFLKNDGIAVLRALVEDRESPDDAASEALEVLAHRLPIAEAGPLLLKMLKHRSKETRRQAVKQLGRLQYGPAISSLIVVLERSNPRTAAAAATALGMIGGPAGEAALLKAMNDDARELRLAATRALGAIGSVRAVEPLLAHLEAFRLDAESRQALREAVSAIQSRLAGAGAGQLSIATEPSESGRLSLAEPTAGPGAVSFVEKDE